VRGLAIDSRLEAIAGPPLLALIDRTQLAIGTTPIPSNDSSAPVEFYTAFRFTAAPMTAYSAGFSVSAPGGAAIAIYTSNDGKSTYTRFDAPSGSTNYSVTVQSVKIATGTLYLAVSSLAAGLTTASYQVNGVTGSGSTFSAPTGLPLTIARIENSSDGWQNLASVVYRAQHNAWQQAAILAHLRRALA
jgi:hypothetical protein